MRNFVIVREKKFFYHSFFRSNAPGVVVVELVATEIAVDAKFKCEPNCGS